MRLISRLGSFGLIASGLQLARARLLRRHPPSTSRVTEGRAKRISPHLVRAPLEAPDSRYQGFYAGLLAVLGSANGPPADAGGRAPWKGRKMGKRWLKTSALCVFWLSVFMLYGCGELEPHDT